MGSEQLKSIAQRMVQDKRTIALTGAGVSTESGIPDFRSGGGLWERFDPMEYATIDAFRSNPEKVWEMLREMDGIVQGAEPNPAHRGLAKLEELGVLSGIVTQNIDNLHQQAGSKNVIEFHGNGQQLVCLSCDFSTTPAEARKLGQSPPRCRQCRAILKPDVVFFGEPIPVAASTAAMRLAQEASLVLVVGTSAVVAPASYIPMAAKKMGALVVEINLERTVLSGFADFTLLGKAGELVPELVAAVQELL